MDLVGAPHMALGLDRAMEAELAPEVELAPDTFCHKGGVICISEVTDISPGNLDSSLCFFQPRVSHDVLCI